MLHKTNGIVLRTIKYGETSLITTIFTATFGLQTYIVKGARNSKSKTNRGGLLQPSLLLNMVVYHNPQKNLQSISEMQLAETYTFITDNIVKNTIALFSVELLSRLLPEQTPMKNLFDFSFHYFTRLNVTEPKKVANFPLFFIINCGMILGFSFQEMTTELIEDNLDTVKDSRDSMMSLSLLTAEDANTLNQLSKLASLEELSESEIKINSATRFHLIEWNIAFLQQHSQFIGNIKSLAILKEVLHGTV